jgi:DNA-binding beta-propeller fold protein YncE
MRSDATNFAAKTVVPSAGQGSDGIAVDLAGGHIYWTNMGVPADNDGSVMRSDLDGSHVTTIVPTGGTWTPKQLKLEATTQKLYWSDREGMRVMRSDLDGGNVETLYVSGSTDADRQDASNWCVGIGVDTASGYFYWTQKGDDNGHTGTIRRAHLALPDGDSAAMRSDVEILYQGLAAPCDLDLDLSAGLIYWANRGDDTINRVAIELPSGATAATRTDREIVVPKVDQAIGVALDHERGLVYYTDAVGDVGRANIDGSAAQFLETKSGAFTGIVIVDLP